MGREVRFPFIFICKPIWTYIIAMQTLQNRHMASMVQKPTFKTTPWPNITKIELLPFTTYFQNPGFGVGSPKLNRGNSQKWTSSFVKSLQKVAKNTELQLWTRMLPLWIFNPMVLSHKTIGFLQLWGKMELTEEQICCGS